ncbi:alpha/beta fold hydrolase [Tenggerimyces flavus]|uniref:Alpha/beta fold hydrolase n=1 Tax=Tenggerimyces flavus TaxID=1708749 RepID=A0ABV7YHB7_9ACTN|nr:alpha/beta hydrolase [Tenggerimyces flavus]MBM7783973.1 pimeloyl-ACP methyl ester carboxylesterase [Tenggerimyces flavus]
MITTALSATSADGTSLGYRSLGQGPGLVLVHGSVESAASHDELASALADSFTVTLYDRRGRGASGPFGSSHGLGTEVADLAAVLAATGSELVFGVSSGGLIALEAALSLPLRKVVVYEPALVDSSYDMTSVDRYFARLAAGDVVGAMVAAMKAAQLGPPALSRLPDFVLRPLVRLGMRAEERSAAPGSFTMRQAAPTVAGDFRLVREAAGRASRYAEISASVLLLGGGQSPPYLKDGLATLERVLPVRQRVEFPRLGHGGSGNAAQRGNPLTVAGAMRTFLA